MNDIKHTVCESSESIVSYLYDEMPGRERERFEDHLLDCTACTDEFAAIANARFGVYEWNKEFAKIETPHFVIPYGEQATLIEKVRSAFQFNWGWSAGAAFASVAVIVGFGYFALMPDTIRLVSIEPIPEQVLQQHVLAIDESGPARIGPTAIAENIVPKAGVQAIKTKMTRPAAKRTPNVVPQQTRFAVNSRRNQTAPRLNEFADDEDESLRLAEIFDEVESSE